MSRNPDKFPEDYILQLTSDEWDIVKSQIATSPSALGGGKVRPPKAFTETAIASLKSDQSTT